MNTSTYFRDWLYTIFKPCILVYSTEKVKALFNKSNLTPADFLRPLGDFKGRQITFPYNDKENLSIPNLLFDFFDSYKFTKIDNKEILQYITTMFEYNKPKWDLSNPTVNKRFSEPYLNNIKYNSTVWYREFEKTLFELLQFNDYEFIQQPFINIFICLVDEPVTIIKDELNNKNNLAKLILDEKYENPKENIIILIKEKKSYDEKNKENKNSDENKENEVEQKNIEQIKKNFITTYKNYYVIYWEKKEKKENNDETNKLFKKYLHRRDLYDPKNDFYRKNDIIFGKYINKNDIIQYKEDLFKYITDEYLNKLLELIAIYNNIIKQKKSIFSFFQPNKKVLDEYYEGTSIYKLNDVERAYYNLGLIYFYFRQYNYSNDNFKSFIKLIKEKSPEHRNRLQELLMIIKFLLIYNTKKEFDINNEVNKLPSYLLEHEIRLEFLTIKMFENNLTSDYNAKTFLNPLKINIKNFFNRNNPSTSTIKSTSLTCFEYVVPLFYEKISIYYLKSQKIRNFAFYMGKTGYSFNELYKEMRPYVLYSLSQILFVIDEPNQSFINFREKYNEILGMNCNDIKYYEGALKFYRNCLKFSYLNNEEKNNFQKQNIYLNFYLNNTSKIIQDNILCENINIHEICVPLVDNRSLFILDENDYIIKKSSEMILETERKWSEFLKYNVKLIGDPYNDLDENDLNHVRFLNNISNNTSGSITNISTKASHFNGFINQKLYVQFIITNPLSIDLIITSIKLLCDFIPENKENYDNDKTPYICSEEKINIRKLESARVTLYIQAFIPGKIIVKGVEILLYNDCKVVNFFNKKQKNLYYHRKRSSISQGDNINNELINNSTNNKANNSFSEKFKGIYSKRIIEYFVKDYNSSLFVEFPMGLNISLYLYEFLMYPIIFTNNSDKNKVKRITIFIENCNNKKLYKFFDYITKEIHLNKDNPTTKIFMPILPTFRDDLYIKLLIKFSDEKRIKPIAVMPFIIKINIKRSISFEFKEYFYNYYILNSQNKKQKLNLKSDITLKENSDVKDIILKEPILNKKYILIDKKNNETKDNKIHMNYYIESNDNVIEEIKKEDDSDDDEEEKIKKRDYSEIIQKCGFFLEDKEGKNIINLSNNHIYEKFNDLITNVNSNAIIFPWESKVPNENKDNNNEIKIKGIYIYKLKLKTQNISKNYIRELFYNSTKLEPIVRKINEEKNLVIINLSINKSGLVTLEKSIDKYDIFIDEQTPFINWFGPNKFTILNEIKNEEDTTAKCRFTFYTNKKGMIEINKIYVLLYKKFEGMEFSTGIIQINHITKPLYLNLE